MEAGQMGFFRVSPSTFAIIVLVVFLAVLTAMNFYNGRLTVPLPSYKSGFQLQGFQNEGFGGAAAGTGQPNCLRSSSEAAALYAMLVPSSNADSESEKSDDARELEQLLGKLSCFKKDLVSPSYIVEATRSLKYSTTHDIEPIAETTGRCFSKTISPRDLEIAFDKWQMRLVILVKRLASANSLSEADVKKAEALADSVVRDVKDVARGACLQGEPMMGGKPGPRDAHPYEPPSESELGKFSGYY
jgi:hypothetical protein